MPGNGSLDPLICVVGPTAVGKTALALALAERLAIEVVSADSRQIYRRMDIGTAKPTVAERLRVPHHLIDVIDPDEILTMAQYQALAQEAIALVRARGRVPVLVGGTGLYVRSLLENWEIPQVAPDAGLRMRLEEEAERYGAEALHTRLLEADPQAAAAIHPNNVRRVIRALEVHELTGKPISDLQRRGPVRYLPFLIGLTAARDELYARADARVDAMMARGLLEETEALLHSGLSPDLPSMSGLGYRQMVEHLAGRYDLSEAVRRTKTSTHRFIRQQHTWFRLDDPRIRWWQDPDADEIAAAATRFLNVRTD